MLNTKLLTIPYYWCHKVNFRIGSCILARGDLVEATTLIVMREYSQNYLLDANGYFGEEWKVISFPAGTIFLFLGSLRLTYSPIIYIIFIVSGKIVVFDLRSNSIDTVNLDALKLKFIS